MCYPGLHAIWGHRVSHWLWHRNLKLAARAASALTRWITGVEIHPGATLGPGLFIDHATGVVIGETAGVGANVTIYQGVTLGGTSLTQGKRHPTVGDRVTIGAGAKVLGPVTVGHDSRIGANAVVVKPVPANSVVVGVPGQVVSRSQPRPATAPADLDAAGLPDLFGITLRSLLARVDDLEGSLPNHTNSNRTNSDHTSSSPIYAQPSETGVWPGEDFSI
jgi:serine O-acetyltransferase